ncbi:hypothetical protein [Dokdonella fugitiva]|jgi:hypothetical protein|uniref:Uncharacterized protein n=1 Tax=Dokdonella fugitiva TaxID=328517 RepID=A0A4R2IGD7_9GAMM|nr:hypothetical protein [Dokdonella fugitiva]TCO41785.1 hypothetical protein EV148_102136 [Dokdonella fugitiva]
MSADASQWWLAALGDTLIWARLDVLDSGIAEVFDNDGRVLRYDDETAARMALLDAEFRAFDGLDADDAAAMGFDLDELEPPRGDSDEELLAKMVQKLPPRH